MIHSPLVTVIMTSYNAESYISAAILSIINQTYTNWELLIADDCSTDGTKSVIEEFKDKRIRTYHNNKNLNYLRTRNRLINKARGEYITLLDADDICSKDRLQLQLEAFLKDRELGMCGSQVAYIDSEGRPLNIKDQKPCTYEAIKEEIKKRSVFTGSSIMIKSNILNKFDGYRDYFSSFGYEDYDLTSRVVEQHKAINLPFRLYYYRQYRESFSKRNLLGNPFKMHGNRLIQQFIKQRQLTGKDKLMENDIPWIINYILNANKPYLSDPSLIYRDLTWSSYNKKMHKGVVINLSLAVAKRPFNFQNFKLSVIMILLYLKIMKE